MALKVSDNGTMVKEKIWPKYYERRIKWVEITPELRLKYLHTPLGVMANTEIGKTIRYSAESVRKIFTQNPDKVNKILWDAIVKYMDENDLAAKSAPKKAETKVVTAKKDPVAKPSSNGKKPVIATKQVTPAVNNFLENRRRSKKL